MAGAVLVSRRARTREVVLLKTLGASRRQTYLIMLVEYLCLGLIATLSGVVLALGAAWALIRYVFNTTWNQKIFFASR